MLNEKEGRKAQAARLRYIVIGDRGTQLDHARSPAAAVSSVHALAMASELSSGAEENVARILVKQGVEVVAEITRGADAGNPETDPGWDVWAGGEAPEHHAAIYPALLAAVAIAERDAGGRAIRERAADVRIADPADLPAGTIAAVGAVLPASGPGLRAGIDAIAKTLAAASTRGRALKQAQEAAKIEAGRKARRIAAQIADASGASMTPDNYVEIIRANCAAACTDAAPVIAAFDDLIGAGAFVFSKPSAPAPLALDWPTGIDYDAVAFDGLDHIETPDPEDFISNPTPRVRGAFIPTHRLLPTGGLPVLVMLREVDTGGDDDGGAGFGFTLEEWRANVDRPRYYRNSKGAWFDNLKPFPGGAYDLASDATGASGFVCAVLPRLSDLNDPGPWPGFPSGSPDADTDADAGGHGDEDDIDPEELDEARPYSSRARVWR